LGSLDERTSFAAEVCYAVDVDLAALRSVDGRAEVDGCALQSSGGSESCESGEGEGGEVHFGGVDLVVLVVLVVVVGWELVGMEEVEMVG
jgi:hypothetical protein